MPTGVLSRKRSYRGSCRVEEAVVSRKLSYRGSCRIEEAVVSRKYCRLEKVAVTEDDRADDTRTITFRILCNGEHQGIR